MIRKLLIITCLISVASFTFGRKAFKNDTPFFDQQNVADTGNYRGFGASMPKIYFVRKDGKKITNSDISKKRKTIIMIYNPLCEHCEDETSLIEKNISKFDKTDFILLAAPNMAMQYEYFENAVHVSKYPQLVQAVDSSGFIEKVYTYEVLPQINIYDKHQKLVKIFTGDVAIDSVTAYLD